MDWDGPLYGLQTPHACLQSPSSFQDSVLQLTHTQPQVCSATEVSSHQPAVSRSEPKQCGLVLGSFTSPERKPNFVSSPAQDSQARPLPWAEVTNLLVFLASSTLFCSLASLAVLFIKNPTVTYYQARPSSRDDSKAFSSHFYFIIIF